jgi:hypothetical protein
MFASASKNWAMPVPEEVWEAIGSQTIKSVDASSK